MTVMDFLENANDLSGIRVRIFDCNSEEIICDSDNMDENEDILMEIYLSSYAYYEVGSYDLYLHNGVIHLELNIDDEPEEDDE